MQGYHSNQAANPGMGGPGRMREQYETMDDDEMKETVAKRARHMPIPLPAPLTDAVVAKVLAELNQGTARAVESCLQCYRDKRMTGDDLTSFMRSIAMHSQTLALVFKNVENKSMDMGEVACADDLAELMALAGTPAYEHRDGARCQRGCLTTFPSSWGTRSFPGPPCAIVTMSRDHATSSWAAANLVPAAPAMAAHVTAAQPPASKLFVARTRKTKASSPSGEELRLMLWWSEKRVSEISRRQHETAGCNMLPSAAERNNAYVRFLMGKLMASLPTAGNLKLLAHVRAYNMTSDMATFTKSVQELVDEYDVTVFLRYPSECSVRPVVQRLFSSKSCAAVASIDLDYDELSIIDTVDDCCKHAPAGPALGALSLVLPAKQPVQGHANAQGVCAAALTRDCGGVKRKRTETLHGAHPEEEEDTASCPVCKDCPRDDDRWVKCDGCGSWYHQICVLFNEIAHGKSVRFFCKTPGCRKRGSRQLNRRQRKPCYPTSQGIESSVLERSMTALIQPVARADRSVLVKLLANSESVREVKTSRAGRRCEELVRSKTLCAFQHALTGSDLLFFIMFVEEVTGADGVGRVEILVTDNNGMYEELETNEALNVEKAFIQSYLRDCAERGFSTARIHIGGGGGVVTL